MSKQAGKHFQARSILKGITVLSFKVQRQGVEALAAWSSA